MVDRATGAFFAMEPVQYVPILIGLAALGGFAEWRLGTARAALALVACHVIAVLGTAGLLWLTRDHGYAWTTTLARLRDAGPSAAFLGAVAAASATLTPPWRGRLRAVLVAYVLLFAVHMGGLADLEHVKQWPCSCSSTSFQFIVFGSADDRRGRSVRAPAGPSFAGLARRRSSVRVLTR